MSVKPTSLPRNPISLSHSYSHHLCPTNRPDAILGSFLESRDKFVSTHNERVLMDCVCTKGSLTTHPTGASAETAPPSTRSRRSI